MEKYEVIAEIGKGSFGRVFKIKRKSDNRVLVWKELNYGKMTEKEKQMLVSEVNILRELRHPNITRYYDRLIDKESAKLYIVMEFCAGGDLAQQIRKNKKLIAANQTELSSYFPEEKVWRVLAQLTQALLECHRRKDGTKILHRDLKPGNVFFDSDEQVKLGDFGLSRMMGDESVFAYTHVGTPYYMSPECISEQRYNEKSDIWSAGCILYEMAALRAPFEATNQIQLAEKIRIGKFKRLPSHYSDELQNVLCKMLSIDQNTRPSVEQLMMHPRVCFFIKSIEIKRRQRDLKNKEKDVKALEIALKQKQEVIEQKIKLVQSKKQKIYELTQQKIRSVTRTQNQENQQKNSPLYEPKLTKANSLQIEQPKPTYSYTYQHTISSPNHTKALPQSRNSSNDKNRDSEERKQPSLLSGIEAQRQKLQDLKRGLNRKPSLTQMSPTIPRDLSRDRFQVYQSPKIPGTISSARNNSSDRNRSRDKSIERKPPTPQQTQNTAQTYYNRIRSASRDRLAEENKKQLPQKASQKSSLEQKLRDKSTLQTKTTTLQQKQPIPTYERAKSALPQRPPNQIKRELTNLAMPVEQRRQNHKELRAALDEITQRIQSKYLY